MSKFEQQQFEPNKIPDWYDLYFNYGAVKRLINFGKSIIKGNPFC